MLLGSWNINVSTIEGFGGRTSFDLARHPVNFATTRAWLQTISGLQTENAVSWQLSLALSFAKQLLFG